MEAIEQGRLRLSGISCEGPPFSLWVSQGFNRHGQMKVGVWISEEAEKEIHTDMPVILELIGEKTVPIFCGVMKRAKVGRENGQRCMYIEAETASSLLDRRKRQRSFQRQGRCYQELVGEVAAPYQGYPVWKKKREGKGSADFCSSMKRRTGNLSEGPYLQLETQSCRSLVFPGTGFMWVFRTVRERRN